VQSFSCEKLVPIFTGVFIESVPSKGGETEMLSSSLKISWKDDSIKQKNCKIILAPVTLTA
jgi:hypothetical protein